MEESLDVIGTDGAGRGRRLMRFGEMARLRVAGDRSWRYYEVDMAGLVDMVVIGHEDYCTVQTMNRHKGITAVWVFTAPRR